MEALADSIRLGAFGLGAHVIHVLDREIELVAAPGCGNIRCHGRSVRA
jgi:hypothetical protein